MSRSSSNRLVMTSKSKFKLTYFDFRGLGEPIRFIFHYAGIPFVDNRLTNKEWQSLKATTPLQQMPVLEVDGKTMMHQSMAICRYLAKLVDLAGNDDFEAYEIDAAAATFDEVRQAIAQHHYAKDPAIKTALKPLLEKVPIRLANLNEAAKNGGFLANGKMSWADLYFVAVESYLSDFSGGDILREYPNLQKVRENVLCHPGIRAWVNERPPDNFQ